MVVECSALTFAQLLSPRLQSVVQSTRGLTLLDMNEQICSFYDRATLRLAYINANLTPAFEPPG